MKFITVGIDTSLRSTGVSFFDGNSTTFTNYTIKSKLSSHSPLSEHIERKRDITHTIKEILREHSVPVIAAIESHFFTPTLDSSFHRRAGLWWSIVDMLHEEKILTIMVTPTELKRWITGRGNSIKTDISLSCLHFWPSISLKNSDEADAAVLAAIGACEYLKNQQCSPDDIKTVLKIPFTKYKALFTPHDI